MNTLSNVDTLRDTESSLCIGPESNTPPKETTDGVSTRFAPIPDEDNVHWYALRTTYNREKKAYDYLVENNCEVFWPTIKTIKEIKGKKVKTVVSRIPNILFARGTFDVLKDFVYDNIHLPYLRFYYEEHRTINGIKRTPLIVPDKQMHSLMIISNTHSDDVILVPRHIDNFKNGDLVKITEGEFKGIEGRVARWHGQQRVAIILENLCTIATAYIPSAFLRKIN